MLFIYFLLSFSVFFTILEKDSRIHISGMCIDVSSLYIGYLTSLRELSLSEHITAENSVKVLRAVAEHCRQVEEVGICARTDGIVEQLITLATSNRRLTSLILCEATYTPCTVLLLSLLYGCFSKKHV